MLFSARAKTLRLAFNLDETSALQNRKLRDALEHFDERLEDPTQKIFMMVDASREVFVVLNERYSFQLIVDEVKSVHELAERFSSNGRLPDRI